MLWRNCGVALANVKLFGNSFQKHGFGLVNSLLCLGQGKEFSSIDLWKLLLLAKTWVAIPT